MKPGYYDNIANSDYHGGAGISKSGLDLVAKSPAHYRAVVTAANDNERQPTAAQEIGTAFHALLLEPGEFAKDYCLALRQSDVPGAVVDRDAIVAMAEKYNAEQMLMAGGTIKTRDELVAMVAKVNETRLPKISASGSKDELLDRINDAVLNHSALGLPSTEPFETDKAKIADLKTVINQLNESRPGLLSDKGSVAELAQALRDAGQEFQLFSELCDEFKAKAGFDYLVNSKGSMSDIAAELRQHGHQVTVWKEVQDEWRANNASRKVLDQDAWDQLHRMRDAVMAHPAARNLLTAVPGVAERSVYWLDETTGELCRCRPDFWREDGIIVDVKTTIDASAEGFAKSVANYRYHWQHPYYLDGINAMREQLLAGAADEQFPAKVPAFAKAFVFLAVEKDACVVDGVAKGVAVYVLDSASVELGRMQYREALDTFAQCKASGKWPGYASNIQSLTLPAWALRAGELAA